MAHAEELIERVPGFENCEGCGAAFSLLASTKTYWVRISRPCVRWLEVCGECARVIADRLGEILTPTQYRRGPIRRRCNSCRRNLPPGQEQGECVLCRYKVKTERATRVAKTERFNQKLQAYFESADFEQRQRAHRLAYREREVA